MALTVLGVIPARLASTRLPGKVLEPLAGRPLIEHVYGRAAAAPGLERVVVLTDDSRVADAVRGFGGEVEMTPAECASGTDRIAWAARTWPESPVINLQGDEPLVDPRLIADLARHLVERSDDPMVTAAAPATSLTVAAPTATKATRAPVAATTTPPTTASRSAGASLHCGCSAAPTRRRARRRSSLASSWAPR